MSVVGWCVPSTGALGSNTLGALHRAASHRLLPVATCRRCRTPVGTVADHLHHRRLELPVRQFHLIKHTELLIMVPHCSARSHKTAEPFARVRKFNITGFRRYSSGTAREKYRRAGIFAWRIALHCGGLHLGSLKVI